MFKLIPDGGVGASDEGAAWEGVSALGKVSEQRPEDTWKYNVIRMGNQCPMAGQHLVGVG